MVSHKKSILLFAFLIILSCIPFAHSATNQDATVVTIALSPLPPIPTWTAPGVLLVSFSGGCLFYARPNHQPAYIACESPAELRRVGDGAYWPIVEGELSIRDGLGGIQTALVPPEPLWFNYFFPIMAMGP